MISIGDHLTSIGTILGGSSNFFVILVIVSLKKVSLSALQRVGQVRTQGA